ncbi:MAG: abortive phage infection protein [Coriobacteriia bacterium]|nr:abortive phage infection protein [Coriobacteriia bacterium]
MSKSALLDSLVRENKGFLKTSDGVRHGISGPSIRRYARLHSFERVAHGLYLAPDAWKDELYIIQVRYPKAVFSHETALYLLGLAEREPTQYTLTLKTGTNVTGLTKQGIKVYKVKDELFDEGIIEMPSPVGHMVRTYNPERTIIDLFRSRRNIEIQELQSAVRAYLRSDEKNIPLLMRYAKMFSVEKTVRQYLEVLL